MKYGDIIYASEDPDQEFPIMVIATLLECDDHERPCLSGVEISLAADIDGYAPLSRGPNHYSVDDWVPA